MGEEKRCMTFKAVGWPTFSFLNVVILSQRSAWQSQGLPTKDLCTPPAEHERGVPHLSWAEAYGLCHQPISESRNHQRFACHHSAIAVSGDGLRIHGVQRLDQPGVFHACAFLEIGVSRSGTKAS